MTMVSEYVVEDSNDIEKRSSLSIMSMLEARSLSFLDFGMSDFDVIAVPAWIHMRRYCVHARSHFAQ